MTNSLVEKMTINDKQLRREINNLKTENIQLRSNNDALKSENVQLITLLNKINVDNNTQIQRVNSQFSEIAALKDENKQLKMAVDNLTVSG